MKKHTPKDGKLSRSKFSSFYIVVAIVPVAICLYLYAAHFRAAGLFHDDGIYMVNAQSLYQGTGYSIASLPYSPPQTKYPPVLALMLSLCWHINPSFPENIMLMRLVSVLCAVLVLLLAWFYLHQKDSYTLLLAFFFLSALAFNPNFVLLSGVTMSEMPFTLFLLASIVLFLHYVRSGSKISLYSSLLLATIAFYTRTIGIALFLSFVLWFLCQRRFVVAFLILGFMVFAAMPWFYWAYDNAPATANCFLTAYYLSYFSWLFSVVQSCYNSFDITFFATVLICIGLKLPGLLCPFIGLHSNTLSTILSIMFAAYFWFFLLLGVVYRFRKLPSVDILYLLITMGITGIWLSLGIDPVRFFIPLLPIVLFHLIEGVRVVREDIITLSLPYKRIVRPLWQAGVLVLLVGIYVAGIPRATSIAKESFCNNEDLFLCMEDACDWIGNNTEKTDVIASHLDPLVYLFSGKHAVNVAWMNPCPQGSGNPYDEGDILRAIERYGVSYLLMVYIDRWSFEDGLRNEKLSEIIKKYPDAFHKCHEKEGAFSIYRVKRDYLVEEHKCMTPVNPLAGLNSPVKEVKFFGGKEAKTSRQRQENSQFEP